MSKQRTPAEHELKTWPTFYAEVEIGRKTFEIRRHDRPFQVGDILRLREWDNRSGLYTGSECKREITYILEGEEGSSFGICPDYVALGLAQERK